MALFPGAEVTLLPTLSPQQSQRKQGRFSSPLYIFMDSSAPLKRQKIISQSKRPHWYSWDKRFVPQQQNPANVNFIHSFQKVKQCCLVLLCWESKWQREAQPWSQEESLCRKFSQYQGVTLCLGGELLTIRVPWKRMTQHTYKQVPLNFLH